MATEISVHDNALLSYTVLCVERQIRLQTVYRDGKAHEATEVVFSGVVAYHFEADNFYTILFDITEVAIAEVYAAHRELFVRQKNYGWPAIPYHTEPELLAMLREDDIKGYLISSSYGMDGFVMAQQMQLIPITGDPDYWRNAVTLPPSDKWDRPYYKAGGSDVLLWYAVFGRFPQPLSLRLADYRSNGLPAGVKVVAYSRADHQELIDSFYEGWLGQSLKVEQPDLFAAVEHAPMCLMLQGTIADPPTLDYLRDVIGVLTALFDQGTVALLDTQAFAWFSPEQWHERIFAPDAPVPRHHVSVLLSPEDDGESVWVHTRGMRKFGRPDLSVRGVAPEYQDACIELCNRFIEMQAFGEVVPEGQPIRMQGLPPGMACHHQGDFDDPDFNNVHLEIRTPE